MYKDFKHFVTRLRLEALALAILMFALTYMSSSPLWILPATFMLFDIGMIGYLFNNKLGATTYNLTHDLTIPALLIAAGTLYGNNFISVFAYSWTFHIAVDRVCGYGLKHKQSFKHTHLGTIGKNKKTKAQ